MKEQIFGIVKDALGELNEELGYEELNEVSSSTSVFSGPGSIDSLTLVRLVTMLEEEVSDAFDQQIILADEKVMSSRNSPFKNVETIIDFITNKLSGEANVVG